MIGIHMLKLFDKFICKPLNIIFKSCLLQGIFLSEWKKENVLIHTPQKQKEKRQARY